MSIPIHFYPHFEHAGQFFLKDNIIIYYHMAVSISNEYDQFLNWSIRLTNVTLTGNYWYVRKSLAVNFIYVL